jgi:hypothetical protein
MAALDSDGKFYFHQKFHSDVINKELTRNPIHKIQDLYPRMNNKRLISYIKKGYIINMNNLLMFLEDQEDTFKYRQSLKK